MTKDGWVRAVADGGKNIKKANDDAEKAKQQIDMAKITMTPRVEVGKRLVHMMTGKYWNTYHIQMVERQWVAIYAHELSNPMPQRVLSGGGDFAPLFNPHDPSITKAAVTPYLQCAGLTDEGYYIYNYRDRFDKSGTPKRGLTPAQRAETRALQRIEARQGGKSFGSVVATRRDVAWEIAKELGHERPKIAIKAG